QRQRIETSRTGDGETQTGNGRGELATRGGEPVRKITISNRDTGDVKVLEVPAVTPETLARAFQLIFDRSFELVSWSEDGKVVFQCKDKDSGQEVMTLRDGAIVLGKTQKEVYGMIGNRAKQTATVLGVKPSREVRIAGGNQYSSGSTYSLAC